MVDGFTFSYLITHYLLRVSSTVVVKSQKEFERTQILAF